MDPAPYIAKCLACARITEARGTVSYGRSTHRYAGKKPRARRWVPCGRWAGQAMRERVEGRARARRVAAPGRRPAWSGSRGTSGHRRARRAPAGLRGRPRGGAGQRQPPTRVSVPRITKKDTQGGTGPVRLSERQARSAHSRVNKNKPWSAATPYAATSIGSSPKFSSMRLKRGSVQTCRMGERPWSPPEERSSSALIRPMSSTIERFQLAPCDTGIGITVAARGASTGEAGAIRWIGRGARCEHEHVQRAARTARTHCQGPRLSEWSRRCTFE